MNAKFGTVPWLIDCGGFILNKLLNAMLDSCSMGVRAGRDATWPPLCLKQQQIANSFHQHRLYCWTIINMKAALLRECADL